MPDVEHDRVGRRRRDGVERLLAVLGSVDLVAGQRQRAAQRVAHRAVVVDDQDAHGSIVAVRLGAAAWLLQQLLDPP